MVFLRFIGVILVLKLIHVLVIFTRHGGLDAEDVITAVCVGLVGVALIIFPHYWPRIRKGMEVQPPRK